MSNETILTSTSPNLIDFGTTSPVTTTTSVTTTTPAPNPIDSGIVTSIPEIKENNIFKVINNLFLFFVSRFFILSFGIFIGIGIVVKFSPQAKSLNQQIQILNKENAELKNRLDKSSSNVNWGSIKDSVILKN
jgi:hypothetical protein